MKRNFNKSVVLFVVGLLASSASFAQPAGQLYDPEPPSDSAYVRVIITGVDGAVDVAVDGKARLAKLRSGAVSDYLVLKAGPRELSLQLGGKSSKHKVDVVQGKAMTLAFDGLKAESKPIVFMDTANTNKLKSGLAFYNLDTKAGTQDVTTADGATKVFTAVAAGAGGFIQVNPISVDLLANKASAKLSMTQGATYSVFLLPAGAGKSKLLALQNMNERYTGK